MNPPSDSATYSALASAPNEIVDHAASSSDDYRPNGNVEVAASERLVLSRLRKLFHEQLKTSHDAAFEHIAAEEGAAVGAAKPIRTAIYLSVRRLRSEEDNLRFNTTEQLIARIAAGFGWSTPGEVSGSGRLALMSENELEDSVLIMSLSLAADSNGGSARAALVAALSPRLGLSDTARLETALSPRAFLEAYLGNLDGLEVEPELRIAALKAFQDNVLHALPSTYQVIAGSFGLQLALTCAAVGHRPRPAGGVPADQSARQARANGADTSAQVPVGTSKLMQSDASSDSLVSKLLETLAGRAAADRGSATPSWPRDRVVGCLKHIQVRLGTELENLQFGGGGLSSYVEQEMRRMFADDQKSALRRLSEVDTAVADLVDMVFDLVIDARTDLATERLVPLATLRIPYLRAALLDRQLFIKRSHPARRLLERLPALGLPCGRAAPGGGSLLPYVQRIHREFGDTLDVFESLDREIDNRQQSGTRRGELAERRVVQQVEGSERLAAAWSETIAFARQLLTGRSVPRLIRDLVERAWAQHLVLTGLRLGMHSTDAEAWRGLARELCELSRARDGVAVSQSEASRRLARLAAPLKAGMKHVGYGDEDVIALWRDIVRVVVTHAHLGDVRIQSFASLKPIGHSLDTAERELLRGIPLQKPNPARRPDSDSAPSPNAATTAPSQFAPAHVKVEGAHTGKWYLETTDGGTVVEHKLVWFGKFAGRYVFVTRDGRKSIDCDQSDLLERLSSGRLVLATETPIVDAALVALFKQANSAT